MPYWLNFNSKYLPNLDELLLRIVFALPKLSNNGFESSIWFSILPPIRDAVLAHTVDINCKIFFVASVLPAPDSPKYSFNIVKTRKILLLCLSLMFRRTII